MVAALVSDVAIVNAFYVWPKLLAAAFLLAALALVIERRGAALRESPAIVLLLGALCGLSYLAHGSTVFGLLPVLVLALLSGLPNWRWLAGALAVALLLVLPWSAFQRHADPRRPGRQVGLAGVTEIDDRGTTETTIDAYSRGRRLSRTSCVTS
jgi:4-amino-4-deoxy-L-arabinose transferase-like glycosyltransferase